MYINLWYFLWHCIFGTLSIAKNSVSAAAAACTTHPVHTFLPGLEKQKRRHVKKHESYENNWDRKNALGLSQNNRMNTRPRSVDVRNVVSATKAS